jgi:hypothetical protein
MMGIFFWTERGVRVWYVDRVGLDAWMGIHA